MIERAEVLVLTHRLSRTRLFSTGSNVTRDSVVVRLEDGDGRVGWGETYLVPGAVEACRAMAEPSSAAATPTRPLAELTSPSRARIAGRSARCRWRSTTCGPRRAACRCPALYGARLRDRVRPYASSRGYVEGTHPARRVERGGRACTAADGFRAMKLRIGRYDLDDEIAAIERVVDGLARR